jgi:hypothetical protein
MLLTGYISWGPGSDVVSLRFNLALALAPLKSTSGHPVHTPNLIIDHPGVLAQEHNRSGFLSLSRFPALI